MGRVTGSRASWNCRRSDDAARRGGCRSPARRSSCWSWSRSSGSAATRPTPRTPAAKITSFYDAHDARQIDRGVRARGGGAVPRRLRHRPRVGALAGRGGAGSSGRSCSSAGRRCRRRACIVAALVHFALADAPTRTASRAGALQALNVARRRHLDRVQRRPGRDDARRGRLAARAQGASRARLDRAGRRDRAVHPVRGLLRAHRHGLWLIWTSIMLFRRAPACRRLPDPILPRSSGADASGSPTMVRAVSENHTRSPAEPDTSARSPAASCSPPGAVFACSTVCCTDRRRSRTTSRPPASR